MMSATSSFLSRLSPVRPWFGALSPGQMRDDALAGLTNAAVVLPQGVAFAIIAGLPPEFGLFTAIVVTAVAAFWGASMVMVSGPTTAISAVVFATLSEFAAPGTAPYLALALSLTLMVGLLQLTAAIAGLGSLIAFVSHSVIVGFTAAAALLIAASQLAGALGLETEGGGGVVERVARVVEGLGGVDLNAAIVSAVTLATLILAARFGRRVPTYIIALLAGSLAGQALGGASAGLALFAPLSTVVPTPAVPDLTLDQFGALLPGAMAVALVGLLEAISIGKAFAIRRGERYDSTQEMVGQGLSNTVGAFFSSYAGSGSFTRSGLNAESGARTPFAAIFAAAILLVALFIVAPFVRYVPVAAMATVILFVAYKLIDLDEIRHIVTTSRGETVILLSTFLTGILSELDFAVLVGVVVSLAVFLNQSARPLIGVGAPTVQNGRRVFRNARVFGLDQCPQIAFMRIEGPLFFGSIEHVEDAIHAEEARHPRPRTLILGLKGVGKIDLSGADFLIQAGRGLRAQGRDLHLIAAHREAVKRLDSLQVIRILGRGNLHGTKSDAIQSAVAEADDEICRTCELRIFHECAGKAGHPVDQARADPPVKPVSH